jgi:hypothetical protein
LYNYEVSFKEVLNFNFRKAKRDYGQWNANNEFFVRFNNNEEYGFKLFKDKDGGINIICEEGKVGPHKIMNKENHFKDYENPLNEIEAKKIIAEYINKKQNKKIDKDFVTYIKGERETYENEVIKNKEVGKNKENWKDLWDDSSERRTSKYCKLGINKNCEFGIGEDKMQGFSEIFVRHIDNKKSPDLLIFRVKGGTKIAQKIVDNALKKGFGGIEAINYFIELQAENAYYGRPLLKMRNCNDSENYWKEVRDKVYGYSRYLEHVHEYGNKTVRFLIAPGSFDNDKRRIGICERFEGPGKPNSCYFTFESKNIENEKIAKDIIIKTVKDLENDDSVKNLTFGQYYPIIEKLKSNILLMNDIDKFNDGKFKLLGCCKYDKVNGTMFADLVKNVAKVEKMEDMTENVSHSIGGEVLKSKYETKKGELIYVLERKEKQGEDNFTNQIWHFKRDFTAKEALSFITQFDEWEKNKVNDKAKQHDNSMEVGGR